MINNTIEKLRFKDDNGNDYPEWEEKKLEDFILDFIVPMRDKPKELTGDIPWCRIEDFEGKYLSKSKSNQGVSLDTVKKMNLKVYPVNTLLVSCSANLGFCAIVKKELITNQTFIGLFPDLKKISVDFLFHIMKLSSKRLNILSSGTTISYLSRKQFEQFKIPYPCLEEQTKIANFLSSVDEKTEKLEQEVQQLKEYKKGVMQQLFNPEELNINGGGAKHLTANELREFIRFKDDNGDEYPNWEVKTLGEISSKPKYGLNSSSKEYDGVNGYIRITDIDEQSRCFLKDKITSPDGFDDSYLLSPNDLLFTRTGASTGKTYIYNENDGKLYFAGFLIKFNIKKANSKFIFYQTLLSEYDKWVKTMSMRSGQPGINAEEYSSLPLFLPCLEEQIKIANFLSDIDEKINQVVVQFETTKEFKKGVMQQMFV